MGGYLTGVSPALRELVQPTVDEFTAGSHFTAGSSTSVTLSADPGTENALIVTMDGVVQHHTTFSLSGTTLSFDAAVPTGTAKIECRYASEHPAYTGVADDAVTLAKMASGTDGNVISYDASGNPVAIATGSDGQVLTSTGAGSPPAFEALPGGSGFEFVSKVTASSSATVSFTNMANGYDYLYMFKHVLPATDSTTLSCVLGIAGPTYRTSAYLGFNSSISGNTNQNGAVTSKITLHYHVQGNADREALTGELLLLDPTTATKTDWYGFNFYANPSYVKELGYTQGFYNADESHTSIKFSYASGNVASGDILQYRRPNA